jgi:hypothetical protein
MKCAVGETMFTCYFGEKRIDYLLWGCGRLICFCLITPKSFLGIFCFNLKERKEQINTCEKVLLTIQSMVYEGSLTKRKIYMNTSEDVVQLLSN